MEYLELASRLLPPIILIGQGLLVLVMWSMAKKFVTREDCKKQRTNIEAEQDKAEARVAVLECNEAASAASRVTTQDLEKIYERINSVDQKVGDQGGELRAMRRNLHMIHQHLLGERQ